MSIIDATSVSAPPARAAPRHAAPGRSRLERSFPWLIRPRRILLALAAVWVINVFDLGYTLLESLYSGFIEMNPVAARLIIASPHVLVGYKTALLTLSSVILLVYRRERAAELGCWVILAAHLYVALRWLVYYQQRLAVFEDPAVNIDPLIGYCPL